MRVLVTGAAGFIGRHVQAVLDERGMTGVPFDLPQHDVRDMAGVLTAVRNVDAVIHLAGRLGTSETFGLERGTAQTNILGALSVADACAATGAPMVQIGTGHKGQPNPYAITKGCAEDLLLARAEVTGQPVTVVRAFHAYGPGQKAYPPHGPSPVRKVMPTFVCRALTGMPLELTGDGSQVIDLVYVRDVAEVLVDALAGPFGTVVDAGTGVGMTVRETAERVIEMTGSDSPIVEGPLRAGEPAGAVVVAEHPRCLRPFPHGMPETVAYYRQLVA